MTRSLQWLSQGRAIIGIKVRKFENHRYRNTYLSSSSIVISEAGRSGQFRSNDVPIIMILCKGHPPLYITPVGLLIGHLEDSIAYASLLGNCRHLGKDIGQILDGKSNSDSRGVLWYGNTRRKIQSTIDMS